MLLITIVYNSERQMLKKCYVGKAAISQVFLTGLVYSMPQEIGQSEASKTVAHSCMHILPLLVLMAWDKLL